MMVPRKLGEYHEAFNEVALDLVNVLRKEREKNNMFLDVPSVLNRWSFECKDIPENTAISCTCTHYLHLYV